MILILELALMIVYGAFCIMVLKKAEHNEAALKTKNSHLLKTNERLTEERDKAMYEKKCIAEEIKTKDTQIEALTRELIVSEDIRQMYAKVADSLKEENAALKKEMGSGNGEYINGPSGTTVPTAQEEEEE